MSEKMTSSPKFSPQSPLLTPLLKVENLTVSWEGDPVFEDASFAVKKGERVCIFGKSGVGKTTLFHAIAGLSTPDAGRVLLANDAFGSRQADAAPETAPKAVPDEEPKTVPDEEPKAVPDEAADATSEAEQKKMRTQNIKQPDGFLDITGHAGAIAYMFQNDLLIEELTVEMNCALPLLFGRDADQTPSSTANANSKLNKTKCSKSFHKLSKKDALQRVRRLLPSFGLKEVGEAYPRELSGGMRQRAALLRTSLTGDRVVLMDEPFSALDTFTKQDMIDFFIDKAESADLTTLFISHNIEEAKAFGTRALIFAGDPQAGKPTHLIADVEPSRIEDFLGQLDV